MHNLPSPGDLVAIGLFARPAPGASVTEYLGVPGSPTAERTFRTRVMGGLEFDVIASRGFDIGDTYYRGVPLSWFSPVADARALAAPANDEWLTRFTGGLLTTCGLGNIGPATTTVGLHGTFDHLPARDIRTASAIRADGHSATLSATVDSVNIFGPSFEVRRTITSTVNAEGDSRLTVHDDVENIGRQPAPFSLLYHLNFGAPLIMPGSTIGIEPSSTAIREPTEAVRDWRIVPEPTDAMIEAVFEHHGIATDDAGLSHAVIGNDSIGLRVEVAWSAATLPRLFQWVFPTRGRWALALEPANAPLFGADRELSHSGAPVLEPGETRPHEIMVAISTAESTAAEPRVAWSRDVQ